MDSGLAAISLALVSFSVFEVDNSGFCTVILVHNLTTSFSLSYVKVKMGFSLSNFIKSLTSDRHQTGNKKLPVGNEDVGRRGNYSEWASINKQTPNTHKYVLNRLLLLKIARRGKC